jgi:enamine deaminase RidA (YjgF/YER057c/UK114 family)
MAHEGLRRFNTRNTYPEQRLDNDLCHVGQDLDTAESIAVGDAAGQAEQAMRNIARLLEEAGSSLEHVCKITIYLIDPRYREPVYRTVGKWLKGVFPVSTGLVVSGLARPEWLVEVDAIAVIPNAATAP